MQLTTLVAEPWDDYGLVDSGHGRKLERYGPWRFIRPEPQAMWTPAMSDWRAHGEFVGGSDEEGGGRWRLEPGVPPSWPLSRGDIKFWAANTP
ncbi:MAG: class I SAM-dependent rRNA methyltransferase, partial [Alphaproteobacteria bacterium]|nr:class I SAM-dependent rRNA methyltransferase [Alphaproteobacteria bacterium]